MPTNANDLMPEGFNGEINYNDDGTSRGKVSSLFG